MIIICVSLFMEIILPQNYFPTLKYLRKFKFLSGIFFFKKTKFKTVKLLLSKMTPLQLKKWEIGKKILILIYKTYPLIMLYNGSKIALSIWKCLFADVEEYFFEKSKCILKLLNNLEKCQCKVNQLTTTSSTNPGQQFKVNILVITLDFKGRGYRRVYIILRTFYHSQKQIISYISIIYIPDLDLIVQLNFNMLASKVKNIYGDT